jgi:hypothetical protein
MMRAKVEVQSVEQVHGQLERLSMRPVTGSASFGPSGESEDNTYARYTPSGSISLDITNPDLHGKFSQGQKFYVDFSPAE